MRLRLEQIQRDFLWGDGALERKAQLERRPTICSNKRKGGLGVNSLAILNKALLGKWSWHFTNEREAFWNQVIRGKHEEERSGWYSCEVREGYGVGLWKAIRKLWHLISSSLSFAVGNGQRVSFWRDKWCEDKPLCDSFPSLFALAVSKDLGEGCLECLRRWGELESSFY